ncbi:MAG: hypothetical protein QW520_00250 [Methanomassiliicoccales archaeon]
MPFQAANAPTLTCFVMEHLTLSIPSGQESDKFIIGLQRCPLHCLEERFVDMRTKLLSFALILCLVSVAMLFLASPALAAEEGGGHEEEHETPGSENGIIVALGGAIGVYGFIFFIVFNILRKRKKAKVKQ